MGFKDIFKSTLPFLAAAAPLPPPFGQMAAAAVGKALGVPTPKPEQLHETVNAAAEKDPDLLAKLKEAEQEFRLKMAELEIDSVEKLESIAAEDRANARAREIAIRDKTPTFLAFLITIGFFALLVLIIFRTLPTEAKDVIMVMIGALGASFTGIVTYYFGSSAGSARKTELLNK